MGFAVAGLSATGFVAGAAETGAAHRPGPGGLRRQRGSRLYAERRRKLAVTPIDRESLNVVFEHQRQQVAGECRRVAQAGPDRQRRFDGNLRLGGKMLELSALEPLRRRHQEHALHHEDEREHGKRDPPAQAARASPPLR